MSVAIEKDALDCVEMLITAGDAKALMPIHLAAKLGKLESLELFLSAGFSGELADKQGRTPLHYCCLSEAAETSLCVSLLCLQAPKSKTRYDHGGQTPIHIAASHDNLVVLIALIDAGVNTEISSQDGKTALRIAQERKCHRVENHLRSLVNEAKQKNSKKKKKGASSVDDNISSERIMEIWERLFENAFKHADFELGDKCQYLLEEKEISYHEPVKEKKNKRKSSNNKTKSKRQDYSYKHEYDDLWEEYEEKLNKKDKHIQNENKRNSEYK